MRFKQQSNCIARTGEEELGQIFCKPSHPDGLVGANVLGFNRELAGQAKPPVFASVYPFLGFGGVHAIGSLSAVQLLQQEVSRLPEIMMHGPVLFERIRQLDGEQIVSLAADRIEPLYLGLLFQFVKDGEHLVIGIVKETAREDRKST